jgi:hypothetical protein
MSPAQALAIAEIREVARTIAALGSNATVAEIAAHGNLDPDMVARRLRASGSGVAMMSRGWKVYFSFDRYTKRWGLTNSGIALARGE